MKIVQSIADSLKSDKGHDIALVSVLIMLAVGSFALGRLSVEGDFHPTVTIRPAETKTNKTTEAQAAPAAVAVVKRGTESTGSAESTAGGKYVASKSGSAYHLPWCSGAQRIKEENKIYFNSKEDAEKAGYHPAGNCKGL